MSTNIAQSKMRTEKAKGKSRSTKTDMRVFMYLLDLYDACLRNADELLTEARLLISHGHVARAFALAYTGWEEVGKAQLVGDFANDMVSQEEFEAAFRDHTLKSAYNWRQFVLNTKDVNASTIEYDRNRAREAFEKRQAAFYVGKDTLLKPLTPDEGVTKEEAEQVIHALATEIRHIREADAMTERIGSASFLK
jgi:AbiV family abortive infection protein